MIQAQAHINQLPNGDFELTACSYLSTTGANVDLMRGASRIKLDIANNSKRGKGVIRPPRKRYMAILWLTKSGN